MQEGIDIRTLEWQAPEYAHKEKGPDFLWTIGLIAIIGALIAVWFHNYVFAIFIIISGVCLIMFTLRKPEDMNFAISSGGIRMGRDKQAWAGIKSFDIKNGNPYNKLIVVTSRYFLPVYTIPLPSNITEEVKEDLLKILPNIEMEESRAMAFMEKLGF